MAFTIPVIQPTSGAVLPGILSAILFLTVFIILGSATFFQLSLIGSIKTLYWNVMLAVVQFQNYASPAILADYDSQIVNVLDYAQKVAANTSKLDVLDEDSRRQINAQNAGLFGKSVLLAFAATILGVIVAAAIIGSLDYKNPVTDGMLRILRVRSA
jgi:hypothetical protein